MRIATRQDHLNTIRGDMTAHSKHVIATVLHDLGCRLIVAASEICNRGEPNPAAVQELCKVIANDLTDDWPVDFDELFQRECEEGFEYYEDEIETVIEGVKAELSNNIFAALRVECGHY